jgi:hypothetical protein
MRTYSRPEEEVAAVANEDADAVDADADAGDTDVDAILDEGGGGATIVSLTAA